ncbi:MAG: hypothetical protein LBE22_03240 [Azoarcus sp.]|jgi:hypothetical protein|nr:hypothetical protein [Azoarcus sp.]
MKKLYSIVAYAYYLLGLLILLALQKNKYEWISGFDPSVGLPEDSTGGSVVFATIIMITVILTQVIIIIKAEKTRTKALSGILTLLVFIVWMVKFIL